MLVEGEIPSNGVAPMFSKPYGSSIPQTLHNQETDVPLDHPWVSFTILPLPSPPVLARGTTIRLVGAKLDFVPSTLIF